MRNSQQWCDRHWGLVLATFGSGDPVHGVRATLFVHQAMMDDERFQAATGMRDGGPRIPAATLNAELDRIAPVCCWLRPGVLESCMARARKSAGALGGG